MRLSAFRIRNFKSIVDTGVCHLSETDNILVLAGQNEAGKTAVVQALGFFGKGPAKDFERLHRRQKYSPEISCEFSLSHEEIDEIFTLTARSALKVRLNQNPKLWFVRGSVEKDNYKAIRLSSETATDVQQAFEKAGPLNTPATVSETTVASNLEPELSTVEKLLDFLVGRLKEFTFYDSFRDLLPGEVKVAELSKYPAIADFEAVFGVNFKEVVKGDSRSIQRVEQELSHKASDNLKVLR